MPKLLQINSNVNSGSAGRIAEQIGQVAMVSGWESYIAYGRSKNESASRTIKMGNKLDVITHGIISRFLDKHGLGSARATKSLIHIIKRIQPDIIHLHGIHGYYINFEILFSYLSIADIPIVWTMHDCWAITGHCTLFSDINCNKWKDTCHACPKYKNYPTSFLVDRSHLNHPLKKQLFTSVKNMTVVSVSKWLNNIMKESYLAKYPMQVVFNGIDVNAFFPLSSVSDKIRNKYNIKNRFILLGVATSWSKGKGWYEYIKLSQQLSDEFIIVLVGLTKKQKSELPPKIIGIQRTESVEELAELYTAADIVLNLSNQETFGLTTVEGFSCGTPSIVYNCTASPELITDETGLIVEPGNIQELLDAINQIKLKGKENYSANCRKRAELFYNKDDRFSEYLQLYKNLLEQKNNQETKRPNHGQ